MRSGSLEDEWDFLAPKEIEDPEQSKPEDWVDEKKIPDPEDIKPEGYDDIPKDIPDPEVRGERGASEVIGFCRWCVSLYFLPFLYFASAPFGDGKRTRLYLYFLPRILCSVRRKVCYDSRRCLFPQPAPKTPPLNLYCCRRRSRTTGMRTRTESGSLR